MRHLDLTADRPQVRLPKLGTMLEEPALGMSENVRTLFQTCQFFDVCLVVKEQPRFAVFFCLVSLSPLKGSVNHTKKGHKDLRGI